MNFKGLIITDGLEMRAIRLSTKNREEAVVTAFNAGADLILSEKADEVRAALTKGVMTGKISPQRMQESLERILAFQKKYPLAASKLIPKQRAEEEAFLLKKASDLYQRVMAAISQNK